VNAPLQHLSHITDGQEAMQFFKLQCSSSSRLLLRCFLRCRYVAEQQLLVNGDLGVAYPVVNGVPYLMPSRGKLLQQESQTGQQAGNS
jgi:uncharacterized protein YbaR (Trm112 family)